MYIGKNASLAKIVMYQFHGTKSTSWVIRKQLKHAVVLVCRAVHYLLFTIGTRSSAMLVVQFTIYNLRFAIHDFQLEHQVVLAVELFTIYSPPPSPTWNQARVALA